MSRITWHPIIHGLKSILIILYQEQKMILKNFLRIIPRVKRNQGDLILAYGRDPFFAGWPDTVQLDYSNPATADAMLGELLRISGQCDGVRCDMAMLVLPEVFERTWGRKSTTFLACCHKSCS